TTHAICRNEGTGNQSTALGSFAAPQNSILEKPPPWGTFPEEQRRKTRVLARPTSAVKHATSQSSMRTGTVGTTGMAPPSMRLRLVKRIQAFPPILRECIE